MIENMWIMVVKIVYISLIFKICRKIKTMCPVNRERKREKNVYVMMKSNRTHESDSDRNMLLLPIFSIEIPGWILYSIQPQFHQKKHHISKSTQTHVLKKNQNVLFCFGFVSIKFITNSANYSD